MNVPILCVLLSIQNNLTKKILKNKKPTKIRSSLNRSSGEEIHIDTIRGSYLMRRVLSLPEES